MNRTITALLMLLALAAAGASRAENVAVPVGQQGAGRTGLTVPHNDQTMAAVEQQFGKPSRKIAPVGNPPITRWVYPQYTVYFEYNKVIHSVVHPKGSADKQ